jgi:hypothetical protein
VVTVGVAPCVSAAAKRVRRTSHGAIVRFRGRVRPAHDGTQILVQRLRRGSWVNVASTFARHATGAYSTYRKRVRLRRGGLFRVLASITDGDHVASASRTLRVRVR